MSRTAEDIKNEICAIAGEYCNLEKLNLTKQRLLQLNFETQSAHIGSSLSCYDALFVLFHKFFEIDDFFILSKGHAVASLLVVLWSKGLITEDQLNTYTRDGSYFPGHPHVHPTLTGLENVLPFSTGSLGHGPSLAAGLALGKNLRNEKKHIWCLCGDGEWQEGSCWEALNFAVCHKLGNLTFLIDNNGLQGLNHTNEIFSGSDFTAKFSAFGAHVISGNGHDIDSLYTIFSEVRNQELPTVVLLNTIKGRGLHNEAQISCHYYPITEQEYQSYRA